MPSNSSRTSGVFQHDFLTGMSAEGNRASEGFTLTRSLGVQDTLQGGSSLFVLQLAGGAVLVLQDVLSSWGVNLIRGGATTGVVCSGEVIVKTRGLVLEADCLGGLLGGDVHCVGVAEVDGLFASDGVHDGVAAGTLGAS